jgi:vacuolar protein sorting-associated protein 13A/C
MFYVFVINFTSGLTGNPIGYFSAPLKQMAGNIQDGSHSHDYVNKLTSIDLSSTESMVNVIF